MPESSIELEVTFRCNWNCDYCLVDTHDRDDIDFKDTMEYIHSLDDNTEVSISGGEPGMLKREEITEIILLLKSKNCELDLITNGLFIEKYPDLLHNFESISYHCVEYIEDDIVVYDYDNIVYNIVVTSVNMNKLDWFFNKHKDLNIKFKLLINFRKSNKVKIKDFLNLIKKYESLVDVKETNKEFMFDIMDVGV